MRTKSRERLNTKQVKRLAPKDAQATKLELGMARDGMDWLGVAAPLGQAGTVESG
jgi:hypothetical protein